MSNIATVILAAGGSTRMGRPKQLLPFGGMTLVRRAVLSAISSGCSPCVVVVGAGADVVCPELKGLPAEIVINQDWARGIGTSIRRGFAHLMSHSAAPDGAIVMLCDQPLVTAEVLRRLLASHASSNKAVTVSTYAATLGPPVIVNAELFPALLELADDQGAKASWASRPEIVHREPCSEAELDIDTSGDYESALTRLPTLFGAS